MRRAIDASAEVLGATSPNPPVGAVVLDAGGQVAGVGATSPAGGPHAEVLALRAAGDRARGGTVVVTLEPCAHHGRTPPCTDALRRAGVARVVVGVPDPNPVAAGGADVLAAAGVDVTVGTTAEQVAHGPLRAWLHRQRTGRPFVTWKYAATLDGRSAAADGTSRWITSPEAREQVHRLRAGVDAVLVGTGTVLADDPALTVRLPGRSPDAGQPLPVVVGTRPVPPGARLRDRPYLQLATHDPAQVLAELADRDVASVLLEGGPTLAGAFLAAGLVDLVVAHLAPALLGAGPAALGPAGVGTIADAHRLHVEHVGRAGPDLVVTASPVPGPGQSAR